nr:immunoglobulin heavy chain junction region [Macaca mulatta]MOW84025.1 immunoglobulin heavy chain junction region [Macaca mulatta]MOW84027.1 immunoglobulin heavy chain junction region [Macaca mulatta]MOX00167.1 immunoglobulin heavy chain junction region [Macaca mulatta]MOX00562.1 immunoglobulin heavy chain junction region [Macaca mulatta]
CARDHSGFDSW